MTQLRISFALACTCLTLVAAAAPLKVVVDGKSFEVTEEAIAKMATHDVGLKEHDGTTPTFTGPLVADVLASVGVALGDHLRGKALATYVLAKASDGYQVVFGLGELEPSISGHNIVLAYKSNGQPLIASAAPFRIVVEGDKKPARCIRMVTELDVVTIRN